MKKLTIAIIVILSSLLFFQLAYYNFTRNKKNETNANSMINSTISTSEEYNSDNVFININNVNEEVTEKQENIVVPSGITSLTTEYKGNLKIITVEKELYDFVYNNVQKIKNQTNWKSVNYILQYYDLHKSSINQMGIYSQEDYRKIANQINKLNTNDTYERSSIDTNSFEQTQDGYLKFTVSLIYKSKKEIVLDMYLANDEGTVPNVKYTSGV